MTNASLPKRVHSLPEILQNFFDKKHTPKRSKMKKIHFRSGIKVFALGAFTGYPVLPGVSTPLSDGDREYREKQMTIAMVTHSSSEHSLQTQSDFGCCMHAWSLSAHAQPSVCPFWNPRRTSCHKLSIDQGCGFALLTSAGLHS